MSLAPQELENSASRCAAEAIRLDSQGAAGMAVVKYQEAIDALAKIMRIYPSSKLSPVYRQRTESYRSRIAALRQAGGAEPAVDPSAPPGEQRRRIEERKADKDFEDLMLKNKPDVRWDEVVGLEAAKGALRESIVFPARRPDLFDKRLGVPHGILMYGPPGCGKTILAAATASEIDGYFITVDAASMMSKWLGEAERNVSRLFETARRYAEKEDKPVLLFIDELDSMLGERNGEVGGEVRVRNQFLTEMDGIGDKGRNLKLYVIGATNKPWSLDGAFLRRFQKRIEVSLPSLESRERLFSLYTETLRLDPRLRAQALAKMFDGYSSSDIRDVCQSAQMRVVTEMFAADGYREPVEGESPQQPRNLTAADFRAVLARRKASVSLEMREAYARWTDQFGAY